MVFRARRELSKLAVAALLVLGGCGDDDQSAQANPSASSASDAEAGDAGEGDQGASDAGEAGDGDSAEDSSESESTGTPPWNPTELFEREVQVTLDGEPIEGAVIAQGGNSARWTTDAAGHATVLIDPLVPGLHISVTAAHPEARIIGASVYEDPAPIQIELFRFDTSDNLEYVFRDPGTPEDFGNTSKCAHCHRSINADWYGSPHSRSASNPVVQDIYAGAAAAYATQGACEGAGGNWWSGLDPATGANTTRCYVGHGALPDLNANCGDTESCDQSATHFGDCADCHAPAIDGEVGGRDLLEAGGLAGEPTAEGDRAYKYGVHCDLCHKVSQIHLDEKPGVGGRLQINRPVEEASGAVGPWRPLTFAPYDDVGHPQMGTSPRAFFTGATMCAGCHELSEAPRLPGATLDTQRWPSGELPMHTTYSEWQAGLLGDVTPCQGCHMPPDPTALNSADLTGPDAASAGAGYVRTPGAVRRHVWGGPRTAESGLLESAGALFVEVEQSGGQLKVAATVRNAGCGHQLPTGEPMRSVLLLVEASCNGTPLAASGGDVVPSFGEAYAVKTSGEDWNSWAGAQVGQVVRVVSRPGGFVDYEGYGSFGDGSFDAQQKGMPVEIFVGEATITEVNGIAVTFDQALPSGDVAYLGDPVPSTTGSLPRLAGAPGFAFARVLVDPEGNTMVPHYRAVDVVSDNRLAPQQEWTSNHSFDLGGGCTEPQVRARLIYRALPARMQEERAWERPDAAMTEVVK